MRQTSKPSPSCKGILKIFGEEGTDAKYYSKEETQLKPVLSIYSLSDVTFRCPLPLKVSVLTSFRQPYTYILGPQGTPNNQ